MIQQFLKIEKIKGKTGTLQFNLNQNDTTIFENRENKRKIWNITV